MAGFDASLSAPAPGVALLRLATGGHAGWAAGPAVAEAALREAIAAFSHPDAIAAFALGLPAEGAALDAAGGLVALAALDLLARREGVPAAILLGGAPPSGAVPVEAPPTGALPRGVVRLPADPEGLRGALLDPATLLVLAEPAAAGGPPGLRRLAAAARAFQVEVALAPAVAHPAAIAAAAQLRAGIPWLAARPILAEAPPWVADPAAPGFGWVPSAKGKG